VGNTGQGPVGVEYRLNAHEVNQLGDFMRSISPMLLFVVFGSILLSIAYGVFVANPLSVGKSRFFLEHRLRRPSVGLVFWPFSSGSYLNVVKATFMQVLIIALWSLLLIVPGIVKSYQYALVPYILAENPGLSWRRALDLSRSMTDGCKFDIFVLQLSFIGWYLLASGAFSARSWCRPIRKHDGGTVRDAAEQPCARRHNGGRVARHLLNPPARGFSHNGRADFHPRPPQTIHKVPVCFNRSRGVHAGNGIAPSVRHTGGAIHTFGQAPPEFQEFQAHAAHFSAHLKNRRVF
jgi:hypothetical protein